MTNSSPDRRPSRRSASKKNNSGRGCLTAAGIAAALTCCTVTGMGAGAVALSEGTQNAIIRGVDTLSNLRSNILGLGESQGPMVVYGQEQEEVEVRPEATAIPEVIIPTTPSIEVGDTNHGIYLDTELGERMTFTSRSVLVPDKEWNQSLTDAELETVETTWLETNVSVPEGMTGVVFAGGFEQGTTRYENGVLLTLKPGQYEFNLRNGEVVLWYPDQQNYQNKDLERIIAQIENGNFDIESPLDLFRVTPDLLSRIPEDLVRERNVEIASFPSPLTE